MVLHSSTQKMRRRRKKRGFSIVVCIFAAYNVGWVVRSGLQRLMISLERTHNIKIKFYFFPIWRHYLNNFISSFQVFGSPSTPILENPEHQTRWYFKYFLGKRTYTNPDFRLLFDCIVCPILAPLLTARGPLIIWLLSIAEHMFFLFISVLAVTHTVLCDAYGMPSWCYDTNNYNDDNIDKIKSSASKLRGNW